MNDVLKPAAATVAAFRLLCWPYAAFSHSILLEPVFHHVVSSAVYLYTQPLR